MNLLPATSKRTVWLHCAEDMFEVVEVEGCGVFISVVCGGVGLYERRIKLTDSEIAAFRKRGRRACNRLVAEICRGMHADREYFEEKPPNG